MRGFDGLKDAVESNATLPPGQRMRATGHSYRNFALSRPVTYSLMFGGGVAPEVYEPVAGHGKAAFEALVHAVLDAQQAGLVVTDDPVDVAMRIWSVVHGAMSLTIAGSGPPIDPSHMKIDPSQTKIDRPMRPSHMKIDPSQTKIDPSHMSSDHKNGVSDSTYERLLDLIEKGLRP